MKFARFAVKFAFVLLLAMNFTGASVAFANTTPWPLDYSADELVGLWTNTTHSTEVAIEHVNAGHGQPEKLFVVLRDRAAAGQGYLYRSQAGFCGTMFQNDGKQFALCLRGRFGVLSVEGERNRMLLATHQTVGWR